MSIAGIDSQAIFEFILVKRIPNVKQKAIQKKEQSQRSILGRTVRHLPRLAVGQQC